VLQAVIFSNSAISKDHAMRRLSALALFLIALPLAACGTDRRTTVVAQPGSTVVAPAGAHIEHGD
jgi:hypothetical protein